MHISSMKCVNEECYFDARPVLAGHSCSLRLVCVFNLLDELVLNQLIIIHNIIVVF